MNVRVVGLTKRYGREMALDGVTVDLEPGRIAVVLGLNGAGKSTLLHCLAGLIAPSRGHILFDGEAFHRDRVDVRQRFAFLPDFPLFFTSMTVLEHCAMTLRLYGKDDEEAETRVVELLKRFDLLSLANAQLATLSRGQAYKAALVAVFAAEPDLLMFDEPMASGMDALGLREFRKMARYFASRGGTVLYTTQIISVAEQFSDEVILLHKGRLHVSGPLPALAQGQEFEDVFAALREES